jgi:hypothetical protein
VVESFRIEAELQGSKHLLTGASGCDPGGTQIKIDQGRSLSICVHHEDVLRRLVTMMVKVIATGISTRPFQYTETPDHTSSRPSDYSLVKEQFSARDFRRLLVTPPNLMGSSPELFFSASRHRGGG